MSESPKVSVIISTYNRAALLPRAVDSVLAQTYGDFELLIVDDCSTDDTPQVIAGFADPHVRALRHDANRGQPAARNTGIREARGEYLAFLDDDDEFTPSSLADRVAALESAPSEVALVYGWREYVDDATGETRPGRRLALEGSEAFEYALMALNLAPASALLVRMAAAREVGGFDERLTAGEDSYLICNIAAKYRIAALPHVVVRYHENHGGARMTDLTDAQRWSVDRHFALHLERFAEELAERPKVRASVLRLRSVYAMEHRRVRDSLRWSAAAFRARPLTLTNIRHALRLAKVFIFYATPLSRYRDNAKAVQRALGVRKE